LNHNSRVSTFETQLNVSDVSYEKKFSSSTQENEIYVAVRLGKFRNNSGTIRLSFKNDEN